MNGVRTVPLHEVSILQAGIGFPVALQGKTTGKYPFAKVGDISRGGRSGCSMLTAADHYVDEDDLMRLRVDPVPEGSILFAKIGEAIKHNHRVIAGRDMLIDNNAMAAIPRSNITSRYLYHYLRTVDFYSLTSSTTVPALRKSELGNIAIPLPPLCDQRRITAILDKAEVVLGMRRESLAHLDALTHAIFIEMIGDPISNPRGWPEEIRLGDVADVASGITVGRKVQEKDTYPVPYLAVVNVQDRRLDLSRVKRIEATKDEIERYRLESDDLLLTEGGDPDKLGRGALWKGEIDGCIHQNHIFRVRLKSDKVLPIFLNWIVGSSRGKRYFLRSAKQTTGIASINMTQLRGFPLITPPIGLQYEFGQRVEAIERLKVPYSTHLAELDALFESLQYRAFRGEL